MTSSVPSCMSTGLWSEVPMLARVAAEQEGLSCQDPRCFLLLLDL